MDISFDIYNDKGDQIRVALSYYDTESLQAFTSDPLTLTLVFYDVALVRVVGEEPVGVKTLMAICDVLFKFMNDNDTAVLCFYCDDLTEVPRNHKNLMPQEYRSRLFSCMFDMYVKANGISNIINYGIKIEDNNIPRFAHFITQEKYLPAVKLLGNIIMEK
ncbi:MAG: hypothetical protein HFJ95_09365 [Muribaculaceae bacterium]|uniref:hypothetical protein n=1 Tax=uncultured Duncaniella sp. TaxID=2768039 RepID=UPI00260FA69C|nr:hypothetical protein [uncultured Duncaniella sp.]MCI8999182.1 hypothetical protein [Muribaculaceae bacterium]